MSLFRMAEDLNRANSVADIDLIARLQFRCDPGSCLRGLMRPREPAAYAIVTAICKTHNLTLRIAVPGCHDDRGLRGTGQ